MAKMKVHTDRLRKGMIIRNNVYTNTGLLLVSENTPVTKDILELLSKHFIDYVIAEYGQELASNPVHIMSGAEREEKMRRKAAVKEEIHVAEKILSTTLQAIVSQDEEIDVNGLLGTVNNIIEQAEQNLSLADLLDSMRESQESLYKHSINVSIMGQILAKWLEFTKDEIEMVTIAGLLHDIGIVNLKVENMDSGFFKEVWENKKRRYEKHVIDGYNIIKNKNIDPQVKQAVLTHHERIDQSGFPLQVPVTNINKISRVVAIADTYDILTMQEKDEEMFSALNVLKYLQELTFSKLDPNMLITFIDKITHSYIQRTVELSDGRVGTIVTINKQSITKPLIKTETTFVDLIKHPDIEIVRFLD